MLQEPGPGEARDNLTENDLKKFTRFRVPPELLQQAGVTRVTDHEARQLGITASVTQDLSGIWFPYVSPWTSQRVSGRLRRDFSPLEDGKPKGKYLTPYGDRRCLYYPPGADIKLRNPATVIVLVEAENSSLSLTAWAERQQRAILPLAMGGCWGWRSRIGKVDGPSGERVDEVGALPDLVTCCSAGRPVIVLLDANVATNGAVRAARNALTRTLVGYGARVLIANLPPQGDINGPDDFLSVTNDEAMATIIEQSRPAAVVALNEAEAVIRATEEADESHKAGEVIRAAEAVAEVDNKVEREALIGRLTKAAHRLVAKDTIREMVADLICRRNQKQTDFARQVKEALTEAVDAAQLVTDVDEYYSTRVYLPEGAGLLLAYYTLNTWTFELFDTVPYLSLESAVPRCGKTTTEGLMNGVACRPQITHALTEATMFRLIDSETPTLIVDEAEVLESESDRAQLLRAIAHAGYKKGGKVPRCQGDEHEIEWYNVFCPKVFATVGGLSGALQDRCIILHLERAPRGHRRASCRERVIRTVGTRLGERLEAYATQRSKELQELYDKEPDEGYWPKVVSDREHELWGPLLIHAKLIGEKAEEALLKVVADFCGKKREIQAEEWHNAKAVDLWNAVAHKDIGKTFSPGDLVNKLLESDAWAKPLSEAKGSNEAFIRKNQAAKIGYFLGTFRLPKIKNDAGRMEYSKEEVLKHLAVYISGPEAENPPKPPEPPSANPPCTQVIDNTRPPEGTEGREGFTGNPPEYICEASGEQKQPLQDEKGNDDDNLVRVRI